MPLFNLGVIRYLGCSTSPSPSLKQLQSLGLHYERFRRLCQVWPHIRPWGLFIAFSTASIPDYLTGEYYGWDTASMAAHHTTIAACREGELIHYP